MIRVHGFKFTASPGVHNKEFWCFDIFGLHFAGPKKPFEMGMCYSVTNNRTNQARAVTWFSVPRGYTRVGYLKDARRVINPKTGKPLVRK